MCDPRSSYGAQTTSRLPRHNDKDKKENGDDDEDAYLPALPPHMRKLGARNTTHKPQDENDNGDEDAYLPALPPHLKKPNGGSTTHIPQEEEEPATRQSDGDSEDESEAYAPALPPHMLKRAAKKPTPAPRRALVGPMLPEGFVPPNEAAAKESSGEEEEEKEEGELVGPMPSSQQVSQEEYRIRELEMRAKRMKDKLEGKNIDTNKPLVRESWMTELPEDRPNFCGLGARQFLRKTPAEKGDRSMWTDTPADRAKKAMQQQQQPQEPEEAITPEVSATRKRDKDLTEKVEEYNKAKRPKSLVDMHKKEMKKKQSAEGPKERRPFSREEDLNVNKFDEAQKATIMKKARQLNDRFSSSKTAKYL